MTNASIPVAAPHAQAPARKYTVLVIDDEKCFRDLIAKILRRIGQECLTAVEGREGLRLAAERRPDLVVLDLGLPGIGGFDVLKLLRADPATRDLRVLVMTGEFDHRDFLKSATLGLDGDAFLVKGGLTVAQIRSAMESLIFRGPRAPSAPPPLEVVPPAGVRLDEERRAVWYRGAPLPKLGPQQFELLRALLASPKGLSLDALIRRVWKGEVKAKTVAKTIQRLRGALKKRGPDPILSIPGGYKLAA